MHHPLRVGVLTPHAAPGPEVELPAMAPGRLTVDVVRVRVPGVTPSGAGGLRALADRRAIVPCSQALRPDSVDVVAHASTGTGYVLGPAAEAGLVEVLHRSWGVPAVSSDASAVAALRLHGVERLALVHPPWFDAEVGELGAAYFGDLGFDVILSEATGLPNDPGAVRPEHVVDWVTRHVDRDVDAVFLGGNGLRAAAAIEEVERRTGLLVLEANQVLLWSVLAAAGTTWPVTGYGRLFRSPRHEHGTT